MRPRTFTDEELLQKARERFLADGPNVSTTSIAEDLGVSQAALFKRFKTKKALMVRALAPQQPPAFVPLLLAGPDARSLKEQLAELLHHMDAFLGEMMPCMAVLTAAGISADDVKNWPAGKAPPTIVHETITGWLTRIHDRGLGHVPSPRATALSIMGSLQSRHMLKHMLREHGPDVGEGYVDDIVDLLVASMRPPEEG